ncbi:1-deoxy-D-xylulose-5-phosphate reductoisomerase [Candidatus Pelagibacter sp.]|uniref:1-deoxy-D-xylulose-5-phosphate reductoisomerase n=1 Tax=Candidatus Pelagibacter sp. TaxID=2024849 RepID=UPI003F82E253
MKKVIAILGSTGSIGKNTLDLVKKDKKNFKIHLLSTNTNFKSIFNQAKKFKVKNIIIHNSEVFRKKKDFFKKNKINIFENISEYIKNNKKINLDYVMVAITGLAGLAPTIQIINRTKKIAIANKEAIICGWNLISNQLKKHNVRFVPVDSEHFSIWSLLDKNIQISKQIDKIFITASGGPFYNLPSKKLKNIKPSQATNHPNWKMGKKISVDSSTLMNKVFEIIEAKNIFDISYNKIKILIHPKSYLHALIKFNNGISKLLIHDTSMKIPIFNTLYDLEKSFKVKEINLNKLNNLNLSYVNKNKFPMINILNYLPNKISLFETVIVSANDELVNLYLKNKIKYTDISRILIKTLKNHEFRKYKLIKPKNINQIEKLNNYVRLKIKSLSV